jgi:hypothetical protein
VSPESNTRGRGASSEAWRDRSSRRWPIRDRSTPVSGRRGPPGGPRFLRTELPNILAKRSDVLSPRMMRIIEELELARIAWAVLNKERNFECTRTNAMEPRPA